MSTIEKCSVNGVVLTKYESKKVDQNKCSFIDMFLSSALYNTRTATALSNFKNSENLSLDNIWNLWSEGIKEMSTSLDTIEHLRVSFSEEPTTEQLLKPFRVRGKQFEAEGEKAIKLFFNSTEGPNERDFKDLITTLNLASDDIKKLIYVFRGGRGFSRNILVILDNNNQAFALEMGYSE